MRGHARTGDGKDALPPSPLRGTPPPASQHACSLAPCSAPLAPPTHSASPSPPPALARAEESSPSLPEGVVSSLAEMRPWLHDKTLGEEERTSRCEKGLLCMLSLAPQQVEEALGLLNLGSAPEEAALTICQATRRPECTTRAAAAFTTFALLPRVECLDKPASRSLFQAASALLDQHARVLVQASFGASEGGFEE